MPLNDNYIRSHRLCVVLLSLSDVTIDCRLRGRVQCGKRLFLVRLAGRFVERCSSRCSVADLPSIYNSLVDIDTAV